MNDYGMGPPRDFDDGGRWFAAARQRVRTPGLLLQLFGAALTEIYVMLGALSVVNPAAIVNLQYDQIEKWQRDQPPAQRQKLPPRDEAIESQKTQGPIYAALWVAAGVVIFIGGSKMKDLRGYGWALAGSILSIFPGMCCCCTGLVPGVWALIVLLNPDVRLAFSRNAYPVDPDLPPADSRL